MEGISQLSLSTALFVAGLAVGSFLNVVALRYDPERFLLARGVVGGRSRCPYCRRELRWFELIPLVSFFIQGCRCRTCGARLSFQYPLVELLSGLLFVFVPQRLGSFPYILHSTFYILSSLWLLVFLTLLLVFLIDLRLGLIPDEANIFLVVLGVLIALASRREFGLTTGSFVGPSALLFGWRENIVVNRLVAVAAGAAFFGLLVLLSRGRAMGLGDVKLMAALGIVFGWPDVLFIAVLGFVFGGVAGLALIALRRKTMRSTIPFGPFIVIGAALIFFFGWQLLQGYFKLFGIL